MIIDAHQHFWVYNADQHAWINDDMTRIRQNFLPDDLQPILLANQVEGCIAVQADQTEAETLFLLALAEKYSGFVKGVVGWVDLRAANLYDQLDEYSQYELLKGFRHVAQSEPDDFLARPDIIKGIRQLAAFDFTYDILIYPTQLKAALQLVREAPQVQFVVDHIAKPYIKDQKINTWSNYMRQLAQQPHVYCKVSGMVTEADWKHWTKKDFYPYLDVIFEAFGVDRLLFGSDWPVCLVAAEYQQVIELLRSYMTEVGFSAHDQAKVLGENTVRFYHLER
ncbi:MAG: amidohydrolase family protein [Spirosomataceae bacterium]